METEHNTTTKSEQTPKSSTDSKPVSTSLFDTLLDHIVDIPNLITPVVRLVDHKGEYLARATKDDIPEVVQQCMALLAGGHVDTDCCEGTAAAKAVLEQLRNPVFQFVIVLGTDKPTYVPVSELENLKKEVSEYREWRATKSLTLEERLAELKDDDDPLVKRLFDLHREVHSPTDTQ